ncbi:MAG: SIS domain-containing protein [Bacillota bacterium]
MKKPGEYSIEEIKGQVSTFAFVSNTFDRIKSTVKIAFADMPEQVIFIGCGTSYYIAAAVYGYFIKYSGIRASYLPCYELELNMDRYIRDRKTLIVSFARCSATSELKSATSKCRALPNVKTLSITCDKGSQEYNDYMIFVGDSEERSIVMTRSFSGLLYAGMLMTQVLAGNDVPGILDLPDICGAYLTSAEELAKIAAPAIREKKLLISLGQGILFGIAGETSIKIKEMCLIPTEVYFTMEYRHGPVSIADNDTLCFLYSSERTINDDIRLAKELRALGTKIISVSSVADPELIRLADYQYKAPEAYLPLFILPSQFLGTYWALEKGIDPDFPRNLSKAIIL